MSGRITVIVPVYNGEKHLSCCLASITGQTWTDLEILLVNDGSRDDSLRICRQWAEKDGRIRVLSQENQGVSQARNLGMSQAAGDYIAFVDADDWLEPDALEKLLSCLEADGSDMALCGFREVREAQRRKAFEGKGAVSLRAQSRGKTAEPYRRLKAGAGQEETEGKEWENGKECGKQAEGGAWEGRSLPPACPAHATLDAFSYTGEYLLRGNTHCWAALFKKELVEQVRFSKGLTIGEDLLFLIDLLPGLGKVSILPDRAYCYYINEEGAMYSGFRPSYMDQITCWELAAERLEAVFPDHIPLAQAALLQAALLTAGKLALLQPGEWRGECAPYVEKCAEAAARSRRALNGVPDRVQEGRERAAGAVSHAALLSRGYRLKGLLFTHAPILYLYLYHLWKGPEKKRERTE